MIPKIIYYTWVSPHPLPEEFLIYINGWKEMMPDYEFYQISMDNIVHTPFVDECLNRRIFTCAAEYNVHLKLFETGGIKFDIDIETVKPFDDLLTEQFFIGCEAPYRLNMAAVGSVPGHWFTDECLRRLDLFDFNNPGPQGIEVESTVQMYSDIAFEHGWVKEDRTQRLTDMVVFNSKYFFPYYFDKQFTPDCITDETYAVHHWAGTWTKYK